MPYCNYFVFVYPYGRRHYSRLMFPKKMWVRAVDETSGEEVVEIGVDRVQGVCETCRFPHEEHSHSIDRLLDSFQAQIIGHRSSRGAESEGGTLSFLISWLHLQSQGLIRDKTSALWGNFNGCSKRCFNTNFAFISDKPNCRYLAHAKLPWQFKSIRECKMGDIVDSCRGSALLYAKYAYLHKFI